MFGRPVVNNEAVFGESPPSTRRTRRHVPLYQRVAIGLFVAPFALTGVAGAGYYYHLHRVCDAMSLAALPVAPADTSDKRILVLSPHCDDETLGVGGQIAEARQAGIPVTVGFLTNGDGFRIAASRSLHEVNVGPSDFVRFAELRQREALEALSDLGVPATNVKFLGYPDRGLKPMWESNWEPKHPFRSGFTDQTRSPYARTFTPGAVYSGASLVSDLVRLMETVRPTDIMVTHPADDHPDHAAAAAFTAAALRVCRSRDPWAAHAHLHYYIVHRGDWPIPQGSYPADPMLPPPGLVTDDTRWTVFPLSAPAQAAKDRALNCYHSQMEITGRFLSSFIRTNELYADLPTPEAGKERAGVATGTDTSHEAIADGVFARCETAAAHLSGDNLARYVEPAADITGIEVTQTGADLAVHVRTRGPASSHIRYTVAIRSGDTDAFRDNPSRIVSVPALIAPSGGDAHTLSAIVSLSDLGLDRPGRERCVWVSAESRLDSRLPTIDRTGYREFDLPDKLAQTAKR